MLHKLLYLRDQHKHLAEHLQGLQTLDIQQFKTERLTHKVTSTEIDVDFAMLDSTPFFNYDIFPKNILKALPAWMAGDSGAHRDISSGDVIVQQINFPPFPNVTFRLICGVKVRQVADSEEHKQFSYETLTDHVETGRAVFSLRPHEGKTVFTIETWSALADWLPDFLRPPLSKYQDFCTKLALERAARLWQGKNQANNTRNTAH